VLAGSNTTVGFPVICDLVIILLAGTEDCRILKKIYFLTILSSLLCQYYSEQSRQFAADLTAMGRCSARRWKAKVTMMIKVRKSTDVSSLQC